MIGRPELDLVPQTRIDHFAVDGDADRLSLAALIQRGLLKQPLFQGHAPVSRERCQRLRVGHFVGEEFDHR
ncbi:hypothetical protein D3C76_1755960 [compost metagenome]